MSIEFRSNIGTFSATGLNQTKSYIEGDLVSEFDIITFDNNTNYTDVITLVLDISGTQLEFVNLLSLTELAPIVVTDSNTWTISSQYADSNGITINSWNDLLSTIGSLYLQFTNSDVWSDFTITTTLSNETTQLNGTIQINATVIDDAINFNQTNPIHEDTGDWTFGSDGQGWPQVNDKLGADSGRTYRVTFSPSSGGDEQYTIFTEEGDSDGSTTQNSSTVFFEGDQFTINNRIRSQILTTGLDWNTDFTIDYTQEVLTGETDVPYDQEIGSLVFSPTTADADNGYTVNLGPYDWTQNSNTKLPNFAIITDSAEDTQTDVLYRVTVQLDSPQDDNDGELRTFGETGTGVWDGTDTLTINGTKSEVQSHLASIEWWSKGTANAFTMTSELLREIDGGGYVSQRIVIDIAANEGQVLPSPVNTDIDREYDEDAISRFSSPLGTAWLSLPQGLDSGSVTDNINGIDANDGVMISVHDGGYASRSTDNGDTWTALPQGLNSTLPVSGFFCLSTDRNDVWIVAGSHVSRSTDNGVTWAALPADLGTGRSTTWYEIETDRDGVWIAVGSGGDGSRSTDNGATWTSFKTFQSHTFQCLSTDGDGIWVMSGNTGWSLRSTDNGETWSFITRGLNSGLETATMFGMDTDRNGDWVAASNSGYASRSTDNGLTWVALPQGLNSGNVNQLFSTVRTNGIDWMVGGGSDGIAVTTIDITNDESWILLEPGLSSGSKDTIYDFAYGDKWLSVQAGGYASIQKE